MHDLGALVTGRLARLAALNPPGEVAQRLEALNVAGGGAGDSGGFSACDDIQVNPHRTRSSFRITLLKVGLVKGWVKGGWLHERIGVLKKDVKRRSEV